LDQYGIAPVRPPAERQRRHTGVEPQAAIHRHHGPAGLPDCLARKFSHFAVNGDKVGERLAAGRVSAKP
jgi:hypothetical protein